MSDDELELDTLGDRKTALFLIMSDTDTTLQLRHRHAAKPVIQPPLRQGGRYVRRQAARPCAGASWTSSPTSGRYPTLTTLIATIRSREISASIILQSQSQLKTHLQGRRSIPLWGNCDTTLFLGGKEKSTLKEISELLGKETHRQLQSIRRTGAARFPTASTIRN